MKELHDKEKKCKDEKKNCTRKKAIYTWNLLTKYFENTNTKWYNEKHEIKGKVYK